MGSRQSGHQFIAALIQKLWDMSWDFWQHRNHHMACGEGEAHNALLLKLHTKIAHHHRIGRRGLPRHSF
eukprot:2149070-Ditylum_brightwellii.AAC.1